MLISKEDQSRIVHSIGFAELNTSGEIRVHIESLCKNDPVERAVIIFNKLKMFETAERNAILIYIALKSRKFAIIGDTGINAKVPEGFWDDVKEVILNHLRSGEIASGLCMGIEMAGIKLREFFPHRDNDINEQSDEISFG